MRALLALFIRSMREDARARLPPILCAALVLVILIILWANERDFARRAAKNGIFAVIMDTAFRGDYGEEYVSIAGLSSAALAIVLAIETRRALPGVAAAE